MTAQRRTGRRPGDSVARAAGVDPALVHHYFGSKDKLFAASLELPFDPTVVVPALLAEGMDGLGERVVRTFLGIWDATPGQGPLLALLRSAVSDELAAKSLRDFITHVIVGPLASAAGSDEAELRATLAASQVLGLAIARYVVRLEPLASAGPDELGPLIGQTLDRYLGPPQV
jgi:AcrR family transcriptional regulator